MSLKELLANNILWKIGGIVLALMLWFHLATERTYEKIYMVEIEYSGLPRNFYVDMIEPSAAKIIAVGTVKQLAFLAFSKKPKVRIDLSSIAEPGVYKYNITRQEIYTSGAYDFTGIDLLSNDHCSISIKLKI